jgi:glycosyltransferase involved in cell wall biosynthesis
MRVLYIDEIDRISGGENWFLNYIKGISNSEIEPILLCPPGTFAEAAGHSNVKVILYNFRFKDLSKHSIKTYFLFSLFRLWDSIVIGIKCRKLHIDIIHSIGTNGHVIGSLIRTFFGKKVMWHIHYEHQKALYRFFKPHYIVFVARVRMKMFNKARPFIKPPSSVIYNGIDTALYEAVHPTEAQQMHIGFIGRLLPEKGIEEFIEAAHLLLKKNFTLKFDIYGEELYNNILKGRYTDILKEKLHQLGLTNSVVFKGFVAQQTAIYSSIHIYVLSSYSYNESCPMVILEAWAAGVPVIATNVGGIPELITHGKTGWLIPPKNPQAIADAVEYIIEHHDQVNQVVENARRLVREKFDYRENAQAFVQLYRKLLDE